MEEVSNEVRVKDEPICDSQSISDTKEARSQKQSIKQEKQSIPISDSKPTKNQTNKRKRQSILVKEEPIDIDMQSFSKSHIESTSEKVEIKAEETSIQIASIDFLNEETTQETTKNTYQS